MNRSYNQINNTTHDINLPSQVPPIQILQLHPSAQRVDPKSILEPVLVQLKQSTHLND